MDPVERGRERWRGGDLAGAEAAFREAVDERPADPAAVGGLAGVLADRDRFDAALRVIDQAAPFVPPGAPDPFGRLRADIYRRSGRIEQAIAVLKDLVEADPAHRGAWQDLALDLAACGRAVEADRTLADALGRMPRDPHLWAARGMVAALTHRPERAVESYELATRCAEGAPAPWRAVLKTHLANALDMVGETGRAIETYREVIAGDSDARLASLQLGMVLWREQRFAEAAPILREAVGRWPDDHDAAYYLADSERRLGRRSEAERIFRDSVSRWPECSSCLFGLAQVVHEQERPGEAALILRHVLAERPDDPDALGLFAEARFDLGEPDAAREIFERAIRLAPHEVRHLYNFGLREREVGRLEAATALFDRAVEIAPRFDRALYFAAVCRTERGLLEEALPYLERFVAEAPPSRAIVRADPILDPLKALPGYRRLVGGSLLDFARPERARPALEALAAGLPPGAGGSGGEALGEAVGAALAAATETSARRGEVPPPPRFYFETTAEGAALVLAERDAEGPEAPSRPLAALERLGDGSYKVSRL